MNPPSPDYQDQAAIAESAARAAALEKLRRLFSESERNSSELQTSSLRRVQLARETGLELQTFCGRRPLKFSFWSASIAPHLPPKFSFEYAAKCVSIARQTATEPASYSQAARYIQATFTGLGIMEESHRETSQKARALPPVEVLLYRLAGERKLWDKTILDMPFDRWSTAQWEDFLTATDWIVQAAARARELLAAQTPS